MSRIIKLEDAVEFVDEYDVVLVSAKGSVPRLAEYIGGAPIKGSWWAHPQAHAIFALINVLADSEQVVICRMIEGRLTMVHRRLWPSLVRAASHFAPAQLVQELQEHTASGKHANREIAFPQWVPADAFTAAVALTELEAIAPFATWTIK